jgi:hypothetical protein
VRHITSVLTLALVMTAMMLFATPAFAQPVVGGLVINVEAKTEHIPECVDELVTTGQPGLHCMLFQTTPPVSSV